MSTTEAGGKRGLFLNFEGTEGSGKSTQLRLLAARLRQIGLRTVETVEPGGTRIGREIRQILLNPANIGLSATAELLLYFASRAQNIHECIRPALAEGAVVLTDRFTDSTMAYQGYARGLGADAVRQVERVACDGLVPDLTFVFEVDLETGLARARNRNRDTANHDESRLDEEALDFHRRVQQAYRTMALAEPARFRLIDGTGEPESVAARVWEAVEPLLQRIRR